MLAQLQEELPPGVGALRLPSKALFALETSNSFDILSEDSVEPVSVAVSPPPAVPAGFVEYNKVRGEGGGGGDEIEVPKGILKRQRQAANKAPKLRICTSSFSSSNSSGPSAPHVPTTSCSCTSCSSSTSSSDTASAPQRRPVGLPAVAASRRRVLASVATGGERIVYAVVDSGAEDTVAPPGLLPGLVVPSPMSKAKLCYHAANGAAIANLGQAMVNFESEGLLCGMAFQIAEVERPLISVSKLIEAGNAVEFGREGGMITHLASGRRVGLERRGGVFLLKMTVRDNEGTEDFPRQEQ